MDRKKGQFEFIGHTIRGIKYAWWRFMHLFMPWMIHYLTDKYQGRWHHVIVDTIYAAVALTLLSWNIGIATWYILYSTPADIEIQVRTPEEITNGIPTSIAIDYHNPNRRVRDAEIRVQMPDGFIPEQEALQDESGVVFPLGVLQKGESGTVALTGVVFGDIGQDYAVRVDTAYEYLRRQQVEVALHRFAVTAGSLLVNVEFPDTAIYGREVSGTLTYNNTSAYERIDAQIGITPPGNFRITRIEQDGFIYNYDAESSSITIPRIAGNEEGEIAIRGIFDLTTDTTTIIGDQESRFAVQPIAGVVDADTGQVIQPVSGEEQASSIRVINPRLQIRSTIDTPAVSFGDMVQTTVIATNTGDAVMESLQLSAVTTGNPLVIGSAQTSVAVDTSEISATGRIAGDTIEFPIINRIEPGEEIQFTLRIPTTVSQEQQIERSITITAEATEPELDVRIPAAPTQVRVRFNSQIDIDAEAIYRTESGEQIGYGPYPPEPNQVTSMRALLSIANINNPLTGVRVTARLSNQVQWTDLYSVSAGTDLSYDPATRTVTWLIPDLGPQSQRYGAQFEFLFEPNQLQIGLQPHLLEDIIVIATDAFTGIERTDSIGAIVTPVPVVEGL